MATIINTPEAPAAIGPYSQAALNKGTLYASGQLGIDPKTGDIVAGGVAEETKQVFRNIEAILKAAGMTKSNIVKTTCYLSDMADFAAMNEVYQAQFDGTFPARTTIAVKGLPKNGLVEIEILAIAD